MNYLRGISWRRRRARAGRYPSGSDMLTAKSLATRPHAPAAAESHVPVGSRHD